MTKILFFPFTPHLLFLIVVFAHDEGLSYMSGVVRKPAFCFAVTDFVFATRIVQFIFYLNPKFQASSHLVCLYSLVCVGPGRKLLRPVFAQRGSYIITYKGRRNTLASLTVCFIQVLTFATILELHKGSTSHFGQGYSSLV